MPRQLRMEHPGVILHYLPAFGFGATSVVNRVSPFGGPPKATGRPAIMALRMPRPAGWSCRFHHQINLQWDFCLVRLGGSA